MGREVRVRAWKVERVHSAAACMERAFKHQPDAAAAEKKSTTKGAQNEGGVGRVLRLRGQVTVETVVRA